MQSALLTAGRFPTLGFRIRRFNQLQVENSIFAFATADSQTLFFDLQLTESVDAKGQLDSQKSYTKYSQLPGGYLTSLFKGQLYSSCIFTTTSYSYPIYSRNSFFFKYSFY